ncbi:MAG: FHA domain-containing protein [Planctomycetota bacterium]
MSDTGRKLQQGARLRYPIYDERGVLLLNAGAVLTNHLITVLERRDIQLTLNAVLEVVEGGKIGQQIPLQGPSVKIGRHPNCHIRPNSKFVSGHHCTIDFRPVSLYLEDLSSTNGTSLNGVPIHRPTALRDGDIIRLGECAVKLHLYAALEGVGKEGKRVAGLILSNQEGADGEPPQGETMLACDGEGRHISQLLKKAWGERHGQNVQ